MRNSIRYPDGGILAKQSQHISLLRLDWAGQRQDRGQGPGLARLKSGQGESLLLVDVM